MREKRFGVRESDESKRQEGSKEAAGLGWGECRSMNAKLF